MKNLLLFLAVVLSLSSCSSNDDNELGETSVTGEWKLIRITGNNMEWTGEDMDWQETYLIRADGTFKKTRIQDKESVTAEGTYTIMEEAVTADSNIKLHLTMLFDTQSPIIASCYSASLKKEYLFITLNGLLKSTYNQCDGPGLEYRRTN
ncbi:MAG: hypothetical protein ABJ092_13170 [Gillisia sp.]